MSANDSVTTHSSRGLYNTGCKSLDSGELSIRRGDRAAEGAALEMLCGGNSTKGSNPFLSAAKISPRTLLILKEVTRTATFQHTGCENICEKPEHFLPEKVSPSCPAKNHLAGHTGRTDSG